MRARASRACSAPGAIARLSRRIDISALFVGFPRSRRMVNGALTAGSTGAEFLAEAAGRMQGPDRSAIMSKFIVIPLLAAILLADGARIAVAACSTSLAEFETMVANDARTGNLNNGVRRRIVAELAGVHATCAVGTEAETPRQPGGTKHRC